VESIQGAELYLALVDRVLEDRRLSAAEIRELARISNDRGLKNHQLRKLHREYIRGLCQVAYADGAIAADDHADLVKVTELLRLQPADLAEAMDNARVRRFPATSLPPPGSLIAFTGDHPDFSRDLLEGMAAGGGLQVHPRVTKKVELLVASDFNSQSSKARKAREYAIPIMPVTTFARVVGLTR
jgi:DNA polymerase-3 subunit epsilon